jgi:hypothetical protein
VQALVVKLAVAPYVPAGQDVHVVDTVAPDIVEYDPVGQLTQLVDPVLDWYLPAAQMVHDPAVPE